MATYAVQFITREGALCGQQITNRARAMLAVSDSLWVNVSCVVIVATANSAAERIKMKGHAVAHVFHERGRAVDWLKQLGEDIS